MTIYIYQRAGVSYTITDNTKSYYASNSNLQDCLVNFLSIGNGWPTAREREKEFDRHQLLLTVQATTVPNLHQDYPELFI